ncbi:PhnB protein [Chitinophaga costaii]|uniref:PhnB protein n=1 Tax=Chitinophaga costaii TaxID=1335309 RepID=A0A1C4BJQ5_9BACT|nr:hypothetical protein [Chitinophaga costaii]SCC07063.1 PhnB protein [Chitinophaga costaii]
MQNNETQKIKTVPDNYTSITPWIKSPSSANLILFSQGAFNAEEIPNSRIINEEGKLIHAVVSKGNAFVMLFDAREDRAPTPAFLNL